MNRFIILNKRIKMLQNICLNTFRLSHGFVNYVPKKRIITYIIMLNAYHSIIMNNEKSIISSQYVYSMNILSQMKSTNNSNSFIKFVAFI